MFLCFYSLDMSTLVLWFHLLQVIDKIISHSFSTIFSHFCIAETGRETIQILKTKYSILLILILRLNFIQLTLDYFVCYSFFKKNLNWSIVDLLWFTMICRRIVYFILFYLFWPHCTACRRHEGPYETRDQTHALCSGSTES